MISTFLTSRVMIFSIYPFLPYKIEAELTINYWRLTAIIAFWLLLLLVFSKVTIKLESSLYGVQKMTFCRLPRIDIETSFSAGGTVQHNNDCVLQSTSLEEHFYKMHIMMQMIA